MAKMLFALNKCLFVCLFVVCLFVWAFTSCSNIFHSYGGEGLLLTYTHGHWAVRVLNLACHTYCDTEHPFILDSGHVAERLAVELSRSVFTTQVCRGWDSNIQRYLSMSTHMETPTKNWSCTRVRSYLSKETLPLVFNTFSLKSFSYELHRKLRYSARNEF